MSIEMNFEQKKAVENIEGNIVVNAGAGTGKTTVLVQRYLEILERGNLEENKEVESIVAITFTKKAAQEMIQRIRQKIREKVVDDNKWEKIYRDIENANISTIHSFCGNIIRENTIELGIDPKFEILDDNVSKKLLNISIENVILEKIENNDEFLNMLVDIETFNIEKIIDIFKSAYHSIRNDGFKIDQIKETMQYKLQDLKFDEKSLENIYINLKSILSTATKASKIFKFTNRNSYKIFINKLYKDESELIKILMELEENLGTSKKHDENIKEIKKEINKIKSIQEKFNYEYYFLILDTLKDIDVKYTLEKREISSLDYEDLQIYVNKLLDIDRYKKYYQEKYKYIMIDEFQDTNELQKEIFYKLSSNESKLDLNNLFVVGDPKQSIYAFRGGDLSVFYDVIDDISKCGKDNVISLDKNYRTNDNLVSFINDVFSNLMKEKYNYLKSNKESKKDIEIEIIDNKELDYEKGESKSELNRNFEGEIIAKRILNLIDEGYRYKDIVLLFRAGTRSHIYENILRKYKIPCYNLTGSGLLKTEEIIDIVNGIKSFLNFDDYISNIGFLRSPMINLSDEEIYLLMKESGNILEKLENLSKNHNYPKLNNVLNIYLELEKHKRKSSSVEFLNRLLEITNYKELLLLSENGRQKYANIEKFISLFLEYDDEKMEDFYDILSYIDELETRSLSEATILSENDDTVRMMTIHKSKGLEFPVVIIPELSSSLPPDSSKINYHKNIGIGLNIKNRDSIFNEIKEKLKLEEEEEKIRVLYVAMTRVEELLILGNQGMNKGFKNILGELIYNEFSKTISNMENCDIEIEERNPLNEDIQFLKEIKPNNLLEIIGYDKNKNKKLSISQYMDFKKCRTKFYLDRKYKLSSLLEVIDESFNNDENFLEDKSINKLNSLDKGNIVHRFCELYSLDKDKDLLLEEISIEFGYELAEMKDEIIIYIENFLKNYREDYDKIYREKEFSIEIDGYLFTGVIDRINIKDNVVEIIDYKTNKVFSKKKIYEEYKEQIAFYGYILGEIFSGKEIIGKLSLLETGEFLNIELNKNQITETIKNIREFIEFIDKNFEIDNYITKNDCDEFCKYQKFCINKEYIK